jgi:hypothetical protein
VDVDDRQGGITVVSTENDGGRPGIRWKTPAVIGAMTLCLIGGGSALSASAHEAKTTHKASTSCGTKLLYGKSVRIRVRGKRISCERVQQIVRGPCKDGKRWSCFSARTPYPPLFWFRSKERFDRRWSTVIEASRYPCSKATLTSEEWTGPSHEFPTRKQILSDDLIRCDLLAGMSISEVEALLGKPTHSYRSHGHAYRDYVIGPERDSFFQIDPELLSIKFTRGGIYGSASFYQG